MWEAQGSTIANFPMDRDSVIRRIHRQATTYRSFDGLMAGIQVRQSLLRPLKPSRKGDPSNGFKWGDPSKGI